MKTMTQQDKPSNSMKIYNLSHILAWDKYRELNEESLFILLSDHEKELKEESSKLQHADIHIAVLDSEITELQSQLKAEKEKNARLNMIKKVHIKSCQCKLCNSQFIKDLKSQLKTEKEKNEKLLNNIKNYQNPYPKDIFIWDNKEQLNFNRGRFNQHCFEIVEFIKTDLINLIQQSRR